MTSTNELIACVTCRSTLYQGYTCTCILVCTKAIWLDLHKRQTVHILYVAQKENFHKLIAFRWYYMLNQSMPPCVCTWFGNTYTDTI